MGYMLTDRHEEFAQIAKIFLESNMVERRAGGRTENGARRPCCVRWWWYWRDAHDQRTSGRERDLPCFRCGQ